MNVACRDPFTDLFLTELERLGRPSDRQVIFRDRVDSTSTDLGRRLLAGSLPGAVVAADFQEKGRGRQGRVWHSSRGGNLYVSLAVAVDEPASKRMTFLPLAAGVAALDAVSKSAPCEIALKWPNDLMVAGRKLGGILCEVPEPVRKPVVAIAGLGVNIAATAFPNELADSATSLAQATGVLPEPGIVAARFVAGLEQWMEQIGLGAGDDLIDAWRARAEPFGRRVRIGEVEGVTVDLAENGRLIIMKDNGERVTIAGGVVEQVVR